MDGNVCLVIYYLYILQGMHPLCLIRIMVLSMTSPWLTRCIKVAIGYHGPDNYPQYSVIGPLMPDVITHNALSSRATRHVVTAKWFSSLMTCVLDGPMAANIASYATYMYDDAWL